MQKYFFTIFMILFLQIPSYAGVEISSKIEKVYVFNDSALVYRKASVSLKKGANVFKLMGLPASIVNNSLSAGVVKGNAKITDVKIEESYLVEKQQERVKSLQERLNKLEGEIRVLNSEISALNGYIDFLKKLMPFSSNVKILQGELEGYAKFVSGELKSSYKGVAEIEQSLNKLNEEKGKLEKELAALVKNKEKVKNITIAVFGQKDEEVDLEIGYLVSNVKWAPQYDLYVDTLKNEIVFDIYASISQNTGEDWRDVKLILSTSKPTVDTLKELTPWYVDIFRPREPVLYKSMGISKGMISEVEEDIKGTFDSQAEIKEGAISFEFILKDLYTVTGDNQPCRVFVTTKVVGKDEKNGRLLEFLTIPKLSPFVFITGNLKNPFEFPILSGVMNIYLDGRFVRTDRLTKKYAPGEDMTIPLGIDESIKVERKLIKKFTEYAGILSKTEKVIYEYEIVLKNGKSKAINMEIKDHYPLSQNEQIKTFLDLPTGREAEISRDGIITWRLDIPPRSSKSLSLKFSIEYPKGLRISGVE